MDKVGFSLKLCVYDTYSKFSSVYPSSRVVAAATTPCPRPPPPRQTDEQWRKERRREGLTRQGEHAVNSICFLSNLQPESSILSMMLPASVPLFLLQVAAV